MVGKEDPRLDAGDALSRAAQRRSSERLAPSDGQGRRVRGRGALLGDRRGSAGGLVRRATGNLSERARRGASAVLHARGVRLAVQRPRHLLPRAQQFRSQRGGAVGRRTAHGAQRSGRGRRDVHARHRFGFSRRGVHHLGLRPRRDRGPGRGESRTSSTSTSRRCAPASAPVCARISAARRSRWCTRNRARPERVRTVDVAPSRPQIAFRSTKPTSPTWRSRR